MKIQLISGIFKGIFSLNFKSSMKTGVPSELAWMEEQWTHLLRRWGGYLISGEKKSSKL